LNLENGGFRDVHFVFEKVHLDLFWGGRAGLRVPLGLGLGLGLGLRVRVTGYGFSEGLLSVTTEEFGLRVKG
jgi:hypothetical protein